MTGRPVFAKASTGRPVRLARAQHSEDLPNGYSILRFYFGDQGNRLALVLDTIRGIMVSWDSRKTDTYGVLISKTGRTAL
jgi:hypothetical protein